MPRSDFLLALRGNEDTYCTGLPSCLFSFFQLYTLYQAGLSVEDFFFIFPKQVSNNVISQF